MPIIREYEAGNVRLTPETQGISALREAGFMATRYASQAHAEMDIAGRALATGIAHLGAAAQELYDKWKEHNDAMKESLTAAQEMGASQKAQERIAKQWEESRRRLALHAAVVQGEVDINHAIHTTEQNINSILGSIDKDPSILPHALEQIDAAINATASSMSGTVAAKGMEALDKARMTAKAQAITAAIYSRAAAGDVKGALNLIEDDKFAPFIGDDKDKLRNHVRTLERQAISDAETARRIQTQQQHDAAMARVDEYLQNPSLKLTDLPRDPVFRGRPDLLHQAETIVNAVRNYNPEKVDAMVSQTTTTDFMRRMLLPDNDPMQIKTPDEIYRAFADGKLRKEDMNLLVGKLKDLQSDPNRRPMEKLREEFLKAIEPTIDPARAAGMKSAIGSQRLFELRVALMKKEAELGPNASSLYDPTSPNYVGKSDFLAPFTTSTMEGLQDRIRSMTGNKQSAVQQPTATMTHEEIASNFKNLFSSGRATALGYNFNLHTDLVTINTPSGKSVTVNKWAAPHFAAFLKDLEAQGYKINDIGGYANRTKRGSMFSYSEHAFGNAIDINPSSNPFHGDKTDLPANIAQLAAKHGLIWGGNWSPGSRDPMHFEWSGVEAPEVVKIPPSMTLEEALKKYPPGTHIELPDGRRKILLPPGQT